jgi:uncharacterized protein
MAKMNLSFAERLILSNEYLILEKLYPERAEAYAECRKVLEDGYEVHYGDFMQHISPKPFSREKSREVLDILSMYEALNYCYDGMNDKSGIDKGSIQFCGFDGNGESDLMEYARYLVEDQKRFAGLDIKYFDSHSPSVDTYQRMLEVWRSIDNKYRPSKDDAIRIIAARIHPGNR